VRPDQHVAWRADHSSERADYSADDPLDLIDRVRGAAAVTVR
jgi:hypothetical protein